MRHLAGIALTSTLLLSGCSGGSPESTSASQAAATQLTVIVNDSFTLPDELKEAFEQQSGYQVTYLQPDSSMSLVNQLILTKDSPLGDVVFGIDTTSSARALTEGIVTDFVSAKLSDPAPNLEPQPGLTPIDYGDVCINADSVWFTQHNLAIPETLDDLTKPEYRDLLVVTSPATSTPGMALLAATVGEQGEHWLDYWKALDENGMKVTSGWTEAYYTDFSGADGKGPRPLVLSYASSPAYTVDGDSSTTVALLDTCLRQVEYAGVLSGAKNEAGAQAFVDFLVSAEVQAVIPENMYMYPALASARLPADWVKFAPVPLEPIYVSAQEIGNNRDAWLRQWTDQQG